MEEQYYLGIDGGGTKTELLLKKGDTIVDRVFTGASNPNDVGMETAKAVLNESIEKILGKIPRRRVKVFAGLAGAVTGNNKSVFEEFFDKFGFGKFAVGSDIENIIALGLDGEDGIAIIMGTGLGTFKVENGKSVRVASLGYLFEDGGSGYAIGRDGIKAYFADKENLGEKTVICDYIKRREDFSDKNFLADLYKGGKRYIATFAKDVFGAVNDGDGVAIKIVQRNMQAVVNIVEKIAKGMKKDIKLVFAGGITNNEYATEYLFDTLKLKEKYRTELLNGIPMVEGAIKRACKL